MSATRLSSSSRTPISERIKLFDGGAGAPKARPSPLSTPNKTAAAPATPTKQTTPLNSPVLKPANRSQFSTKDPTTKLNGGGGSAKPSPSKKSPASSVASSKSDLSRTPSNASTRSNDAVSRSPSSAAASKSAASKVGGQQISPPGRSSPSPTKKVLNGGGGVSATKKALTSSKSGSSRSATAAANSAASPAKSSHHPPKQDENQAPKSSPPAVKVPPNLSRKASADKSHPAVAVAPAAVHDNAVFTPSTPSEKPESRKSSVHSEKSAIFTASVGDKSASSSRKSSATTTISEQSANSIDIGSPATINNNPILHEKKLSLNAEMNEEIIVNNMSMNDTTMTTTTTMISAKKQSIDMVDRAAIIENNTTTPPIKKMSNGGNDNYWSKKALSNSNAETMSKVNGTEAMKLDVESRDERINTLQRDITDLQLGGATEDEVRALKKGKKDLEMQLKEQEEELDDLAAQVQMLEGSKTKLEMEMAAVKKEHRREIANKEEEIEEARASANKKVKILEQQLEQEHEERIMFLRERHDLEQKIGTLQDMLERSGDEEQVAKLKRDLKKTKALLRDAQTLVEKNQNEGTNKVILRQLKNQLEDAEFARTAAMKARQNAELELADIQTQLEDVSRSKQDLEDKHLRLAREKAELASQLTENEEELQEVMRKYKASVAAVSTDQITIQDQQTTIQELEDERNKLREAVAELSSKLGNLEGENVSTSQHKRLELKIRELESKLELEQTSKGRLETQITRLKEQVDKLCKERDDARIKEQGSVEQQKKLARSLRDMKEDYTTLQGKETELGQKKFDLEKQLEVAEAETLTVRSDLKLALKRVEDLQAALAGELESDNSDDNSDSSDEEMHSFLEHHRRAMSVQRERESMARESVLRESILRETSVHRDSMAREVRASVGRNFAAIDEVRETTSLDLTKSPGSSIDAVPEADESQA